MVASSGGNGENYGSEFLVMLNTWEAAVKFLPLPQGRKSRVVDIARFLGWVLLRDKGDRKGRDPGFAPGATLERGMRGRR
jgi:hypothetical protein